MLPNAHRCRPRWQPLEEWGFDGAHYCPERVPIVYTSNGYVGTAVSRCCQSVSSSSSLVSDYSVCTGDWTVLEILRLCLQFGKLEHPTKLPNFPLRMTSLPPQAEGQYPCRLA